MPIRRKLANREKNFWQPFEPYADTEFLTEIRNNFGARYWEMYLAAYRIKEGL